MTTRGRMLGSATGSESRTKTVTIVEEGDLASVKRTMERTREHPHPPQSHNSLQQHAISSGKIKNDHDRITDLERTVGAMHTQLTNARATVGRLQSQVDVLEVAIVREMEGGDGWRSSAMTAYERDFQRLKSRVKDKAKIKSEKEGFADYDQDAYQSELWGDPGSFQ